MHLTDNWTFVSVYDRCPELKNVTDMVPRSSWTKVRIHPSIHPWQKYLCKFSWTEMIGVKKSTFCNSVGVHFYNLRIWRSQRLLKKSVWFPCNRRLHLGEENTPGRLPGWEAPIKTSHSDLGNAASNAVLKRLIHPQPLSQENTWFDWKEVITRSEKTTVLSLTSFLLLHRGKLTVNASLFAMSVPPIGDDAGGRWGILQEWRLHKSDPFIHRLIDKGRWKCEGLQK